MPTEARCHEATSTYASRLAARRYVRDLERQIAFGYVVGWAALLLGGARWFLVRNRSDAAMLALAVAGAAVVLVTLLTPTLLARPERAWRAVTGKVADVVFKAVLLVVYALAITPVGWLRRRLRGNAPFYSWTGSAPEAMEGWTAVSSRAATTRTRSRWRMPVPVRAVALVGYMIRQRQYVLLPACILLIALGLLLFFVQTSSLAPLLYTLF